MPMKLIINKGDANEVRMSGVVNILSSSKMLSIFYYDEGDYKDVHIPIIPGTRIDIVITT